MSFVTIFFFFYLPWIASISQHNKCRVDKGRSEPSVNGLLPHPGSSSRPGGSTSRARSTTRDSFARTAR